MDVLSCVCIKEEGKWKFLVVFASKKRESGSSWSCLHQRRGKVEVLGRVCIKEEGKWKFLVVFASKKRESGNSWLCLQRRLEETAVCTKKKKKKHEKNEEEKKKKNRLGRSTEGAGV